MGAGMSRLNQNTEQLEKLKVDLLIATQKINRAKKQLEELNPDADAEYCLLQPPLTGSIVHALLMTGGVTTTIIATGATGFAGAFIIMAAIFGHGAIAGRPIEITYQCPFKVTRAEIKKINIASAFIPMNRDFVVSSVEESTDGKYSVKFLPSPRRSDGDDYHFALTNEAFVIYVKRENHPTFSGEIKKLRSTIKALALQITQLTQSIESVNRQRVALEADMAPGNTSDSLNEDSANTVLLARR